LEAPNNGDRNYEKVMMMMMMMMMMITMTTTTVATTAIETTAVWGVQFSISEKLIQATIC